MLEIGNKSILCTICARGGSKGVKNKNIRLLNGKPLIGYTIEIAKETKLFDHIIVSSDSEEIISNAKKFGAEVIFKRPDELSQDNTAKLPVIQHALLESEKYFNKKFDYLIDLDATSPLRNKDDIFGAFETLINNNYDNVITASNARRSPYFNLVEINENGKVNLSKKPEKPIVRRQDSPKCFDMNASIYVWKRENLLNNISLFSGNCGIFIMPEERSIDIDSELDFEIVEYLIKKRVKE
jgi:CMP-N,N'-diacetyllegionaminic acid synthase